MTLLVVMSPCALVLRVPSAILSAIASGARRGVFFRGGAAIETLADVRTVALDKTGTLTKAIRQWFGLILQRRGSAYSAPPTTSRGFPTIRSHAPFRRWAPNAGSCRRRIYTCRLETGRRNQRTEQRAPPCTRKPSVCCVEHSWCACEAARAEEHDVTEVWVADPATAAGFSCAINFALKRGSWLSSCGGPGSGP